MRKLLTIILIIVIIILIAQAGKADAETIMIGVY